VLAANHRRFNGFKPPPVTDSKDSQSLRTDTKTEAITAEAEELQGGKPRAATRPQRWLAASRELLASQAEYAAWLDALPETLRDTPDGGGFAGDC
jgi:hypothetical protein